MSTDRKIHGGLLIDLHNDYVMGNDNYPATFADTFSLLLNYRKKREKVKETSKPDQGEDDGVSFAQREETPTPGTDGVVHPNTPCCNHGLMGHYADHCPNPPQETQEFNVSKCQMCSSKPISIKFHSKID